MRPLMMRRREGGAEWRVVMAFLRDRVSVPDGRNLRGSGQCSAPACGAESSAPPVAGVDAGGVSIVALEAFVQRGRFNRRGDRIGRGPPDQRERGAQLAAGALENLGR